MVAYKDYNLKIIGLTYPGGIKIKRSMTYRTPNPIG